MRLLISGSQVRALVRPPYRKPYWRRVFPFQATEQSAYRATLLVVGHRTVRRLGDVREMFLLVRITVALVISHGRQYRP